MAHVITGGDGPKGSFVNGELSDRGHDVTVIDLREPAYVTDKTFVEGNVTHCDQIDPLITDANSVVHMVSVI